ncbi:hypothetical protein PHACT_08405 [Pseudohongiella acticola]|uniref:Uncharacterized protein n=1 Tax=Pseudohongiella acticola TaxID=1524254 RepID=A0A1E8CL50_9GAMM|nr:hypothetical protein PHACT_08405 [Pseudohongiella acticola]
MLLTTVRFGTFGGETDCIRAEQGLTGNWPVVEIRVKSQTQAVIQSPVAPGLQKIMKSMFPQITAWCANRLDTGWALATRP